MSDLPEVERRLRATFARRAEDMAAGDRTDHGPEPEPGPGGPAGAWPATAPVIPAAPGPSRSRRGRVALVAAVAAVVVPLAIGAVVLARGGDEPTRPAGRPEPSPEEQPGPSCPDPGADPDSCDRTPAPTTSAPATTTSTASVPAATGTVPAGTGTTGEIGPPATTPAPATTTVPAPPVSLP